MSSTQHSRHSVINRDTCPVDDLCTRTTGDRQTQLSNAVDVAHRCCSSSHESNSLVLPFQVDVGHERVCDVRLHATHHQRIASDSLVAVVRSRVLGQANKAVLASGIRGTCTCQSIHPGRRSQSAKDIPAINPAFPAMETMLTILPLTTS